MFIEVFYLTVFITVLNLLFGFKKSTNLFCGLVGFSGTETFNISIIRTLLWHNSLTRGKHATGIFNPSMGIVKDVKEAKNFFKLSVMDQVKEGDQILMGHVRHATVGKTDDPNAAHPWDFGDIVMMHNGTLKNHEKLASDYGIKKEDWSVDSQVLGLCIQKNFKDGNPFKVLNEYIGAAAVIVYHKQRNSLFVYRDNERTLFYGYLNGQMYISSLDDILEIIGCENIKPFEPFKVHEIKEGKILTKILIKRKTANKNNIVMNIVKKLVQIITFQSYSTTKFMLDSNTYTGFDPTIMKAQFAEGYHLEALGQTTENSVFGRLTRGKFYKPIRIIDDRKLTITNDDNKIVEVFITFFNVLNFIPVPGSYVIILTSPSMGNLKVGGLYEVIHHAYGFSEIVLRDHESDTFVLTQLTNIRKASDSEVTEYFKNIKTEDKPTEPDTCKVICLPPAQEAKNIEVIEDAEVIEEEVDDKINPDELLLEGFITALKLANDAVDEIVEFYTQDSDDTIERVKYLQHFLEKCLDIESGYILNVNENSLQNLDVATYVR